MPQRLIPRPAPSHAPASKHATIPAQSAHSKQKQHKTISTAAILKRKPMAAIYSHSHRAPHRRRREKGVHPLLKDYQDDLSHCLASAESRAVASLTDAYAGLVARVEVVKNSNSSTLSTLQTQSDALLAPLDGPGIDGAITASSGENKDTGPGRQIETFRAHLLRGEKELDRLWKLWSEAQEEIEKEGEGGYKEVLKGWEDEVREKVADMEREVQKAGREAVRGVGEAEKEIDRKLREDQAKLVAMMFGEE